MTTTFYFKKYRQPWGSHLVPEAFDSALLCKNIYLKALFTFTADWFKDTFALEDCCQISDIELGDQRYTAPNNCRLGVYKNIIFCILMDTNLHISPRNRIDC